MGRLRCGVVCNRTGCCQQWGKRGGGALTGAAGGNRKGGSTWQASMMHAHIQAGVPWACMSPQQQTPEGAAWVAFAWRQLQATRRGGLLPPASPNHCQAALPGTTGMPALLSPAP